MVFFFISPLCTKSFPSLRQGIKEHEIFISYVLFIQICFFYFLENMYLCRVKTVRYNFRISPSTISEFALTN